MKMRMNVYFEPGVLQRVEDLAARKGLTKSTIIEAAVASFLSPDAEDRREAAFTRRLDRLTRQVERLERDLSISTEAFALFVRSFGVPFVERSFGSDPHQSVAIYPAAKKGGPLFAFVHGGGWTGGYKETMAFMAPEFCSAGITFASLGYRLAPEFVFPTGVEDCAAGLKLLCDLAGEFGYDRNRIVAGGHSAGGHYAALLAVRGDWQAPLGLPADVIKGCLPISGVYRFDEGSGLSMRPRFLGAEGSGSDQAASPILHIRRTPPFLIAYGDNDFPHLRVQAQEMAGALLAAGGDVETVLMPGRDHFTASLAGGEADGPWVRNALQFIARISSKS